MKHVFVFDLGAFAERQFAFASHGMPRLLQQEKPDVIQDRIGQYFRTQVKPDWSVQQSRFPRDAIGIIQKEADEVKDNDTVRVYAIGGDEILFDCLNGVAGLPQAELAAVPYGRTNDFVRAFEGGRPEKFRNIPTLVAAPTIPTDIIDTGNNFALIGCAVGFSPAAAVKLRNWKKSRNRFTSFFIVDRIMSFFSNLSTGFNRKITARSYKITIDDQDYSGNYSLILVSNCPYYGGSKIGVVGAVPNDGLLDVALFKSAGPLRTLMSLGIYSRRKKPSNCTLLQAKKISVQSDEPVWIQLDSEFLQDSSINFEVVPGAVQIVAVDSLSYRKQ
jgi:diacylglycerol kinase family enzyme